MGEAKKKIRGERMKVKWMLLNLICLVMLTACQTDKDHSQTAKKLTENIKPFTSSTNFLLIGMDTRGEVHSRSDSIILAQYNPKTNSLKLASFMRDTYVKIPGYKSYSKVNNAYYFGGEKLLKKTIKENFNIPIDHVVAIDFSGFVKIVDLVAPEGIKVNVKPEMIADMNLNVKPGVQYLHGDKLLKYVRFRHDDLSDFGRVKRQQEVVLALKEEVTKKLGSIGGIIDLPKLIQEGQKYVDTDLPTSKLLGLGASLVLNPVTEMETLRIPIANSFENKTYQDAGAVLEINLPANQSALKEFFSTKSKE